MKVLRFKQVRERVPYSRMHIDRLEKAGKFPKRVHLGPNSVGWLEQEVDAWISARAAAREDSRHTVQTEEAAPVAAARARGRVPAPVTNRHGDAELAALLS